MGRFGGVFPVLPGEEDLVRSVAEQIRGRWDECVASRGRAGITMERVWLQSNPDGSALQVVYSESAGDVQAAFRTLTTSEADFDRWFFDLQPGPSGINFRGQQLPPAPEVLGSFEEPGASRTKGLAFAVPIAPGKTEAGIAFCREAYQTRAAELAASRAVVGVTREGEYLNRTPMGDIAVVYLESDDPVASNQEWAASQSPFDRWFKDDLKEKAIFPPFVDFDQPVPANDQIWDSSPGPDSSEAPRRGVRQPQSVVGRQAEAHADAVEWEKFCACRIG